MMCVCVCFRGKQMINIEFNLTMTTRINAVREVLWLCFQENVIDFMVGA